MSMDCVCDPAVNSAGDRYSQIIGSFFGDCVYSTTDYISFSAGLVTLVLWMFAQFPQLWLNYKLKRVDALSIGLLASWFLGDFTNFLGCILTNQLPTQRYVAAYYVIIDCVILSQFLYYRYFYLSAADAADASELLHLTSSGPLPQGALSDDSEAAHPTGHVCSRSVRAALAFPMMPYGPGGGYVPPSPCFSPRVPPSSSPATPLEITESTYSALSLTSAHASTPAQASSRARKALYAVALPLLFAGVASPHLLSETTLVVPANGATAAAAEEAQTSTHVYRSEFVSVAEDATPLYASYEAVAATEPGAWYGAAGSAAIGGIVGGGQRSLLSLPTHSTPTTVTPQPAPALTPATHSTAPAVAAAAPASSRRNCRSSGPPRGSFLALLGPPVAWTSGVSYLLSRTPQISLMLSRGTRAAEGLAAGMFATAFVANGLYGLSVLLRLPHIDAEFWSSTAPFLMGSLGTMLFDATILVLIAKARLRNAAAADAAAAAAAAAANEEGVGKEGDIEMALHVQGV